MMAPKKATPSKRTPPSKKPVPAKATPPPPPTPTLTPNPTPTLTTPTPPKTTPPKRGPAPKGGAGKTVDVDTSTVTAAPVAEAKTSDRSTQIKPATANPQAGTTTRKVIKRVVKKKVVRAKNTPGAKVESASAAQDGDDDNVKMGESQIEEQTIDATAGGSSEKIDTAIKLNDDTQEKESAVPLQIEAEVKSFNKGKAKMDEVKVGKSVNTEQLFTEKVKKLAVEEEPLEEEPLEEEPLEEEPLEEEPLEEEPSEEEPLEEEPLEEVEHEVEQSKERADDLVKEVDPEIDDNEVGLDMDTTQKLEAETGVKNDDEDQEPEEMVEYGEEEAFVEPGDEEFQDDDGLDTGDDTKASEVEQMELSAAEEERKIRKQVEVFVGGLDHEVEEEDVKNAFEKVGDVVEVRLLKDPATGKNRGFAFVRFATKEHASRALAEMKNPVIRGKRCGTAPSDDNDTLFVGNICNTWTKEAIKQKLKDYGVEGVEHITLVQDPRHEGLSRGFCFIQFSCHADAMIAYKRLQKPDVILGHLERTAKVAFAEPLREPDPEVMAKVKSVFVDGLPPYWDEDRVREQFKAYGEIERITLARNMSTAKRKDFGFVDFTTHEAALACIEDVNSKELGDGKSKAKVKARLSNPAPKTQAVKGGMCGGFPIGRGGASMRGRGFMRGGRSFNQPFHYGRGFYQGGRGQYYDPVGSYSGYHERRPFGFGGRRGSLRAGNPGPFGSPASRPSFGGPRHGAIDQGVGRSVPSHRELPPEEEAYSGPGGRRFDDPYLYDDRTHGMKRPLYMADQEPGYMEQRGVRPRFDYADPGRENRYRDTYGPGNSLPPSGYYSSDYAGGPYSSFRGGSSHGGSSFRGGDRSYGGGYYY